MYQLKQDQREPCLFLQRCKLNWAFQPEKSEEALVWSRVHGYKLGVVDVHVGCHNVSHREDFHGALSARHKDAVRVTRCIHGHADEVDASRNSQSG